ncbi:MAG TPA: hypothetical protein VGR47_18470 [Terracidiphilus sp.]|nr:hypothetical protein [Terracidiphilus sp.]
MGGKAGGVIWDRGRAGEGRAPGIQIEAKNSNRKRHAATLLVVNSTGKGSD